MNEYILLIDAAGMSISLMANRMEQYARANDLAYDVEGVADSMGGDKIKARKPIAIMVAPQVRYMLDKYVKEYEPQGIPVGLIEMQPYGMMNGEKVLKSAIELSKKLGKVV
ncbi:PTS cellobiose transporter subunit IIB [Periweissella cryptocerci]|uniref:PTS cellobiose transporter subunit IIB n=1 Tax=Periweissella cryptocerci TaxID=2506420 RepID=A0A4P6YR79_9LACO|nr:PTS cellobiose transporter subunit IIB [Periweissella cryptocerci]QBO35124.1 PTS cellobiose transporter subunit IIB [Periweissella cryptocerci]